jgi:hypothetical protein
MVFGIGKRNYQNNKAMHYRACNDSMFGVVKVSSLYHNEEFYKIKTSVFENLLDLIVYLTGFPLFRLCANVSL